jgi:predicted dehydrogenase
MSQPVRVVQVGLGGFGRGWAGIVRDDADAELVAVVDPAEGARAWAMSELGLPGDRVFATLDEAIRATSPDAVIVVTPPETHHAVATTALAAGCHVLMEKPLATTIEDARDLVAQAERAQRLLVVSQNYRFRSPARAAQAAIAEGAIGELVAIKIRFARNTRTLWPPDNFRYLMRHPLVLDMSIHHADLLRMLSGRNVARLDARSWRAPDSLYHHHPDVTALMELEGGIPVVYEGTWAARGPETSWNAEWEIVGELGVLRWTGGVADPLTGEVLIQRWDESPSLVPLLAMSSVDRAGALRAFLAAISSGGPAETTAADNIHSLAIVLACVRSIEQGEPVSLSLLLV